MEYKKSYSFKKKETRKYGSKAVRTEESTDIRRFENPVKPLMSEEDASRDQWNHGSTEQRTFGGTLKPLMSEAEKEKAQILELSYE